MYHDCALEMKGITKYFASTEVLANNNVDFSVEEGEVHAWWGENGAGKTTLMNILYGLEKKDSGTIHFQGEKAEIGHPDDAIRLGLVWCISILSWPSFTIAQNIMLGMEPNTLGVLRQRDENNTVQKLAESFGLPVDPRARIRDLPVGMQQRVEILKTLQRNVKLLILDEPTAVLTPQEVHEFLEVVRGLAKRGCTCNFHHTQTGRGVNVADRVSVMRGGVMVGTKKVGETSIPDMARMMLGVSSAAGRKEKVQPREIIFEAKVFQSPAKPVCLPWSRLPSTCAAARYMESPG